jgi:hypothetical protein
MNRLFLIVFLIVSAAFLVTLQTASFAQNVSSESQKPTEAELQKIQGIIKRSDTFLREGEAHLRNKEFAKARDKFDRAIDTILESGLDVRASANLEKHYLTLVERISSLETSIRGFRAQKFEPSPSDKLSKPNARIPVSDSLIGQMPHQLADGRVPIVIQYLEENLNDPYSMKLIRWSTIQKVYRHDKPYWYVRLRLRAKNGFGAYILKEAGFYLRQNKVVLTDNL